MISKAAGKRIAIAIMTGEGTSSTGSWSLTYRALIEIMRAEDLRPARIPDLMRQYAEEGRTWELLAVAKVCANEAMTARAILRKFHGALFEIGDHFPEEAEQ